jgi:hypothetical protein
VIYLDSFTYILLVQNDLEYDPALYRRDRGELDWDARSMASTTMFDPPSSPPLGKHHYHASNTSLTRLTGYDRYLASGAQPSPSDIELSKMDSIQQPLLSPQSNDYFQHHQALVSQQSFSPSLPPSIHQDHPLEVTREAPTHRPQEGNHSPYGSENNPAYTPEPQYRQGPTTHSPQQYPAHHVHHPQQDSASNLAGRGTYWS